jgi:hypothetical protein
LHHRLAGAALRALEHCVRVYLIFERPLHVTRADGAPEDAGYAFGAITSDDLLGVAADPTFQLSAERVRSAHRDGDLFFGVRHRGRLVGFRWYALSGATPVEDGLIIRYARPGRAYGYRTFTHPDHRGRNLHVYSTLLSDAALRSRGCTHVVGYIAADNLASLRANSRLEGTNRVGFIVSLRIPGRRLVLHSPGAARHAVSMAGAN